MKKNLAVIIIWVLIGIPVVLWLTMTPLANRFGTFFASLRSIGQLLALVGMALFSLNFIIAARFKFIDKIFLGLNRAYINHHTIGGFALIFLLFHPLALTIQYLPISLNAAFSFLITQTTLDVLFGKIALGGLIVLLGITFYLTWKYHNWKLSHKLLGIPFLAGATHMLLVSSDVSRSIPLRYYMLAVIAAGVLCYLWRTVFQLHKTLEYAYEVADVKKLNDQIVELALMPKGKAMSYLPGQFVFARFDVPGISREVHPYSITSSSTSHELRFGIKALGDFTKSLQNISRGADARVEGPFGAFSFTNAPSKKQIWIAGGIGITPFVSMARYLKTFADAPQYSIDLYYIVRTADEAVYFDEFADIAQSIAGFRVHTYFSEGRERFDTSKITVDGGNIAGTEIYICGPSDMMADLRKQFVARGISNSVIHSEEFSLY